MLGADEPTHVRPRKDDGSCVIFRRRSARQATIPSSQPKQSIRQIQRQEIPARPARKEWKGKSPGGSADFRLDGSATRASTAQSQWLLQIDQSAGGPTYLDLMRL